jgi:hypothetical protein
MNMEEFDGTENMEYEEDTDAEFEELTDEDMEQLAGGTGFSKNPDDTYHFKGNFMRRRVHGVKYMGPTSCLTFRYKPGGKPVQGHGWQNGDWILVNKKVKTHHGKWAFVYSTKEGGKFGYADKNYF